MSETQVTLPALFLWNLGLTIPVWPYLMHTADGTFSVWRFYSYGGPVSAHLMYIAVAAFSIWRSYLERIQRWFRWLWSSETTGVSIAQW